MDPLGESSDCSDNDADKSREFGHGTNVKRQQFNSKQRMDMYAFCVLELELHGGKVSVKKQNQAFDKVLTKSKIEPNNHYYNGSGSSSSNIRSNTNSNTKNTIRLQVSQSQMTDLASKYQQQQLQQQHLQQMQHIQHLQQLQQHQPHQPHVRRVILLKRLPSHTEQQQHNHHQQQQQTQQQLQQQQQLPITNGISTNNNVDNVQNVPEEEQVEDEEQYTYEPTTDVIGDHQYSKKMVDYVQKEVTKQTTSADKSTNIELANVSADNHSDQTTSNPNISNNDNMNERIDTQTETNLNTADANMITEINNFVANNRVNEAHIDPNVPTTSMMSANSATTATSATTTTTTTTATATATAIASSNIDAISTPASVSNSTDPPKPGTRTKTGRKPVKRSKSPEAGYNYLEPKALWAHQAWAGRKCYSDVQKTQVLTSWMLRNVQQRFAFYYPESAIPSRTTIKHVFQKCISLGTVDNIKNYRKCTKIVDRNSIEQLMLENPNFSLRQLATKLNVSTGTVSRRCKALGLVPDSVTLKHQQLATARRQKQIQALQQDLGISELLPPKPSTSRARNKSKQQQQQQQQQQQLQQQQLLQQQASTSSGHSGPNSPYKYYQPPPPTANSNRK